ncbi:MAG: hypothetical protein KY461_11510, partial [Actinobacteria bacterium]|nr:hypothetical protein [Actinomycetota bacterium]
MRDGTGLPLLGSLPVEDACITCGDVAVVLTVVEVGAADARCRADDGAEELVATELVEPLAP